MDFYTVYHFLFETYEGIGCLVGAGLVLSILFAFISERRTKKTYKDRGPRTDSLAQQETENPNTEESDTSANTTNNA